MIRGPSFIVLAEGFFPKDSLSAEWRPAGGMDRSRLIDERIALAWKEQQVGAKSQGHRAYSARLCRLVYCSVESRCLRLAFGPTDFRELIGTNRNKDGAAKSPERRYRSNATGVCSVVATIDGRLIIQRRKDDAVQAPGCLHVCGGMLEPEVSAGEIRVNPFGHMAKELAEELGILAQDVSETWCLGVVEDERTLQPEVVFETRLTVGVERFAGAAGPEHKELVILDDHADSLREFLVSNRDEVVPVGFGCLALYGKRRFGQRWYEKSVLGTDRSRLASG